MRIAYFVDQFPSVSETFVLDQITGLIERGHRIDVFASRPQMEGQAPAAFRAYGLAAKTRYFPSLPTGIGARTAGALRIAAARPGAWPLLWRALSRQRFGRYARSLRMCYWAGPFLDGKRRYDAIHAHFGPNGIRANLLRRLGVLEGPLVTTFHGFDMTRYVDRYGESVYAELFREGDLFLPISERWRGRLLEMGCPEERTSVHHMGIDTRRFAFRERGVQRREGPVRFISVARLVEKKGLAYAIRALATLNRDDVVYDIVGDGPLRTELERLAQRLGVGPAVRFHGWLEKNQVAAMLGRADVLIAPSVTSADGDQEGIPVALMEAMAMGLPVVSTHHSGIPELVEDGVAGLLADERDVRGLAKAMSTLVLSPERRQAMGKAGWRRVVSDFDLARLNDDLEALLAACAKRGAPSLAQSVAREQTG